MGTNSKTVLTLNIVKINSLNETNDNWHKFPQINNR